MKVFVYSVGGLVALAGMMDEPLFTLVMVGLIIVVPLAVFFWLRNVRVTNGEALAFYGGFLTIVGGLAGSAAIWSEMIHEDSEGLLMIFISLVFAMIASFVIRIFAQST